MLVSFDSSTRRDFAQRFAGVFGWYLTDENKEILVRIEEVGNNKLTFTDENNLEYTANADRDVKFKFIPVQKRVFMFEGSCFVSQRRPLRQYKRGMCSENTDFLLIPASIRSPVTFPIVKAYLNPQYTETISRYKDDPEYTIGALSPLFSVRVGSVYLYNVLIGKYDTKNKVVMLDDDLFQQELIDLFTKENIQHNVVVK